MAIHYEKLVRWEIPEVEQHLTRRDTILYALGVGLGADPCDADQLRFVYENGLQALPTMAIVLGYPGPWHAHPDTGITRSHVVHGEQGLRIVKPLPVEGDILGKTRVTGVVDKGKDKGALVMTECTVREKASGEVVCTLTSTTFCRADGGFSGPSGPVKAPREIPESPPQHVCDLPTLPQAALIYRLSGDYNPLHADPAYAKKAGFRMPILHGRCTFSVAGHAILKTLCGYDPSRLVAMEGRFSSPVYPGETIRTEMWRDGNVVSFRSTVPARGVTVLDNGRAEIR
ncbi:MAG: 3-alpha,7-alpha,12-alpha-trihydroxy-5-beta-cholest-24-enoyl-CoA hydratase [Betaproteobacteria bacterium RIFCSPLOWO2_02_FULL_67_26]|nr:MAG: 3-alpha,7-alpha,12-alpha-trihydroxy-5-beta-cholest-24-enoyl-CoA hydratase [Betaproteobacteria bacterium RIFCSPLOWO2_02_FULL_67_26]